MKQYLENNAGLLREFSDFVAGRSPMGHHLVVFSVFFPLLNLFTQVIPLQSDFANCSLKHLLSPTVITLITTLVTCFVLLSTRNKFKGAERYEAHHRLVISMRIIPIALIAYLNINQLYSAVSFSFIFVHYLFLIRLFLDFSLLIAYTAFFTHITRSFMLLSILYTYDED
jgi:hypothetical protein